MCGIAGIVGLDESLAQPRLLQMMRAIEHRGPDDRGLIVQSDPCIALGHQRLAILDLSPLGHQPMTSRCGRYTIVFNGEVYNFRPLRQQLLDAGAQLASHSDTEVILELFAREGIQCLHRLDGMFAFAIWDSQQRQLICARDPLGIKPFYFWQVGNQLAFSSEVRSVLQSELAPRRLDHAAVEEYLLLGSVQEPRTLVAGIESLPAGHWLTWHEGQVDRGCYWQLKFDSTVPPELTDHSKTLATLRAALEDSIARHFVSDVPVGIFLSGGIDSTAVLALAHAQRIAPLQTFCIGFEQPQFDEGHLAAQTAKHFGTEHHHWRMSAEEGRELFHDFTSACDLPSNDGFNTYCVSRFARKHALKVVLSGLGGDEMFGGYPAFHIVPKLLRLHRWMRRLGLTYFTGLAGKFPGSLRYQRILSFLRSSGTPAAAHWAVRGFFTPGELPRVFTGLGLQSQTAASLDSPFESLRKFTLADQIAWLETQRYMRNQLLRDSDVMSMSVGLELRTPLVDRKLMDVVSQIPAAIRLQSGKRLLTDAIPEIPSWILNHPKRGFRFPFEDWLAGAWKEMFTSIEDRMPVPLRTWPRKWILLLLEQFIQKHDLELN